MRKLAIAMALASTALGAPALAADQSWYAGVEGGLMIVEDATFNTVYVSGIERDDAFDLDHKRGVDLDLIGGYDFGMFRAEVEAGYKRASVDEIRLARTNRFADVDGSVRVYSAMANLMLDFGPDDRWSGFVGGGAGLANVRYKLNYLNGALPASGKDSDRSIAYQAIAGVRVAMSDSVDLGLKYRYFVAPKLDYNIDLGRASTKFRSHSLMASLIFNFGAPVEPLPPVEVAPPPPPPAPPATQTCPDGSVILASDLCLAMPVDVAPPPPPPAPERG